MHTLDHGLYFFAIKRTHTLTCDQTSTSALQTTVDATANASARIPLGAEHAATVHLAGRTMAPRPAQVCIC